MKQICILCEDSKVELARLNIKVGLNKPSDYIPTATNFGPFTRPAAQFLSVPLSETGDSPATHWFCFSIYLYYFPFKLFALSLL